MRGERGEQCLENESANRPEFGVVDWLLHFEGNQCNGQQESGQTRGEAGHQLENLLDVRKRWGKT